MFRKRKWSTPLRYFQKLFHHPVETRFLRVHRLLQNTRATVDINFLQTRVILKVPKSY